MRMIGKPLPTHMPHTARISCPWNSRKMWPIRARYLLFWRHKKEALFKTYHWLENFTPGCYLLQQRRHWVRWLTLCRDSTGPTDQEEGRTLSTPESRVMRDLDEVPSTSLRQRNFSLEPTTWTSSLVILLAHVSFPFFTLSDLLLSPHPIIKTHFLQNFDKFMHSEVYITDKT